MSIYNNFLYRRFIWNSTLFIVFLALFPFSISYAQEKPMYIFILAGQSNMAGRAKITDKDKVTYPNIFCFNYSNKWEIAKNPLHQPGYGLGPGLSFAKRLSEKFGDNIRIGIVPCAVGNTSIEQWLGDSLKGVNLYSNMISKAKAAAKSGVISGIIWHQGESNSKASTYKGYKNKLKSFILQVRNDLNNDSLPFISGELGEFLSEETFKNFPDSINNWLHELVLELNDYNVVSSDDLEDMDDKLHFDSESQRKLGKRYADTWFENYFRKIGVTIGSDTSVFADKSILINAGCGFDTYLWSNGTTSSKITVDSSGAGFSTKVISVMVTKGEWTGIDSVKISFVSNDKTNIISFEVLPHLIINETNVEFQPHSEVFLLSVVNIYGVVIYNEKIEPSAIQSKRTLNFGNFPAGFYFVRVSSSNNYVTKALVKQ